MFEGIPGACLGVAAGLAPPGLDAPGASQPVGQSAIDGSVGTPMGDNIAGKTIHMFFYKNRIRFFEPG